MTELLQNYGTVQAQQRPEATAVVGGGEVITYRELSERSNQLARMLKEIGCQRGDRVCLLVEKTPVAIVAMQAILKADCAYVPIDGSSPAKRVARILKSCDPRIIMADNSALKLLDELFANDDQLEVLVGSLSDGPITGEHFHSCMDARDVARMSPRTLACNNDPGDAAHILFTSGSTGEPKGVVITHENVAHFVNWGTSYFQMGPQDRISNHAPFHFDLSTFDIYGSLSVGAEFHLVPPSLNLVPAKLAQFIRDARLTQWFSVPSVLTHMAQFNAIGRGDFPHLKRLMWCGEVLPTPTLIHLMTKLPHVEFTNLYGPTEATIASSFFTLASCPTSPRDRVPIGRACDGEQLLVLDAELQPKPPGETGDLYICGAGLSPGYWCDPEKTDEGFRYRRLDQGGQQRIYMTGDLASLGDDGLVYFLGRSDTQIKSRGYRIELGEIETAFNAIDLLQDCAIVAVSSQGFEGTTVCCAYVPKNGHSVSPAKLRKQALQHIPNYMLPVRWKQFSHLPMNQNGKIDRPALKEMFKKHATDSV